MEDWHNAAGSIGIVVESNYMYTGFFKQNWYEMCFSHTDSCMTSDDILGM
jgi:hypothetical protein